MYSVSMFLFWCLSVIAGAPQSHTTVVLLLSDVKMEWASSQALLAVGGSIDACQNMFVNAVHFYTPAGSLLLRIHLPDTVSLLWL